jgi:hypothetical protein
MISCFAQAFLIQVEAFGLTAYLIAVTAYAISSFA